MTTEEFKKNGEELANLLEEKVPNCKIDYLSLRLSNGSKVSGSINAEPFHITVKRDEYLLVSAKGISILESMKPVLVEYMGNTEPICQYQQTIDGNRLATMEWDIQNPKNRIADIVNGTAFDSPAEELVVFGYNVEEFTNEEARKAFQKKESERIKNARIDGIDPGCVNPNEVEAYSEWELFFAIDSLGYYLWWQKHEESHGRVEHVDLTDQQYGISYLVNQTKKYGVELPEPKVDQFLAATESYHKWYQFWKTWMKSFSDSNWKILEEKMKNKEDISDYLPKKKWNEE
jgi:hypothetical protein